MSDQIQNALSDLMSRFKSISASLMQITFDNIIERDKGFYGVMYARPSRRLATSLTIDREILVLFSTFPDQQQRTVATVTSVIGQSSGRLESGLAIVVHCDPRGNNKLRNWGREQGLSILAVHSGATPLPEGDAFERLLCVELYSYDPFDITGPVADDSQFFGRRTEAQDLARKLQSGQIRSCFGIRKVGKTSILNRILSDIQQYHDAFCIMLDCSLDHVWVQDAGQLLNSISAAIEQAVTTNLRYNLVAAAPGDTPRPPAERLLDAILSCEKPLIIFVDEVDYITPGSPTGPHWKRDFNILWRAVRAAYQEAARRSRPFSILIGGVSSKWFSVESIEGVENAALALVPEEYLTPLPRGASVAMIKRMSRIAGLQFDDNASNAIASACSDMPFWIRKACSHVHRHCDVSGRPFAPPQDKLHSLIADFIENDGATIAQVAISHLFRVFPELEEACRACARGDASGQPVPLVRALERYGVVDAHNAFRLSGQMIQAGFEQYSSTRWPSVPDGPPAKSSSYEAYGEWAEELAVISRRRNIVERQLREIALNFVRFDALSKREGPSVSERIMAVLPQHRKDMLRSFQGENLIGKMMWTELISLICREWTLFDRVFGDRKALQEHAATVNDRPDAHAKPVTAPEVGLHNRSLDWFERRLST